MSGRLNIVCIDSSANAETAINWYFTTQHVQGDQIGLVHLYSLPNMLDEDDFSKDQMASCLQKVKDLKNNYKAWIKEQINLEPQIFFENATDTHGKMICQIAEKTKAAMIVISQAGVSVSGTNASQSYTITRYLTHNSKTPVMVVPAHDMPPYVEESASEVMHAGPVAGGPMRGRGPPAGRFNPMERQSLNPYEDRRPGPHLMDAGPRPMRGGPVPPPMRGGPVPPLMDPRDQMMPPAGGPMATNEPVPADVKGPPFIVYCYYGERVVEEQLMKLFAPFGRIDRVNCQSEKGFGFVHFLTYREAIHAVENLNGSQIPNSKHRRQVTIQKKKDFVKSEIPEEHSGGPPYVLYCYIGRPFTENDIYHLFAKYGRILKVNCIFKSGFAFIHFHDYHDAVDAINGVHGQYQQNFGKPVQVKFKTEKE